VIPPAPWVSEIDAVLWWARGELQGLITYRDGPVGPYREVFSAPLTRRGARVTFMAVDSERSLAGGRANWALPKEMARFESERGRVTATGDRWTLRATIRARPRAVPAYGAFRCAQVWPDGAVRTFAVQVRGRARIGSVELAGGERHAAVLVSGRQVVGPAR
jgi:Acetoacetate decarboxylase (ADC)